MDTTIDNPNTQTREAALGLIEAHFKGSFTQAVIDVLDGKKVQSYRLAYNLARACKGLVALGPEGLGRISQKVYDLTMLLSDQAKEEGVPPYSILPSEVRQGFIAGLACSAFGGTSLHRRRLA